MIKQPYVNVTVNIHYRILKARSNWLLNILTISTRTRVLTEFNLNFFKQVLTGKWPSNEVILSDTYSMFPCCVKTSKQLSKALKEKTLHFDIRICLLYKNDKWIMNNQYHKLRTSWCKIQVLLPLTWDAWTRH